MGDSRPCRAPCWVVRAEAWLALLAQLAAPCRGDWVYSPNSYMYMQLENCQTQEFEKGPCGACLEGDDPFCDDANSYSVPTAYSVITTVLEESCVITDAGRALGVADATCTSVPDTADNDADKSACEDAGDPAGTDNYCQFTYPGPVDTPRTLRSVHLLHGENYTVSWHIRGDVLAASGSSAATRRSFMFMSLLSDSDDDHPCPATLAGRHSFLQELCEHHTGQSSCGAAGPPCSWNEVKSLCEVAIYSQQDCTGSTDLYPDCGTYFENSNNCPAGCTLVDIPIYTGTSTFAAPDQTGTYSLDLYNEVACPEERTCPEVTEEKPDIIKLSASLVGDAMEEHIRAAIAEIAGEEPEAVLELQIGASTAGQPFEVHADVRMSSSNATVHQQVIAAFSTENFAATLTEKAGSTFHEGQTTVVAITEKGEAPCWSRMHSIEFVVAPAQCETACSHGTCVLTDTCVCDPGWGHTPFALDCARPLCPPVYEQGCIAGCCNGGNCTAPATCTCPQGWGGADCRDHVCEPHWDDAKMIQFRENGGEGSACENGGVCIGYNTCNCSAAWTGDGCQINVNECVETHLQSPTCSTNSKCHDIPGDYQCTCLPHYVGDGAYCYSERNATVKVFAPGVSGYELRRHVVVDVATALGIPPDSIAINSVDESSAAAWVELRVLMVVDRPPAVLCEELLSLMVNVSEAAGGDGVAAVLVPTSQGGYGLAFDVTYGVEVSEWVAPTPPLTRTFALELTLTAEWDAAFEDQQSDERTTFETAFKASVATELDIDASRVNITGISEGSIRVRFELLPDPTDPASGATALSVVEAVSAFEDAMAACIDGPAICPTFGGFEPAAYSATETTPPPPAEIDEEALLQPQEINCYSKTDLRCEQVACSTDAECRVLDGMLHNGAHAYCIDNVCEDGMVPKDNSGAYRARPPPLLSMPLGFVLAVAAAGGILLA